MLVLSEEQLPSKLRELSLFNDYMAMESKSLGEVLMEIRELGNIEAIKLETNQEEDEIKNLIIWTKYFVYTTVETDFGTSLFKVQRNPEY